MKHLIIIIVCMCFSFSGFGQITDAEYFFDTDPGVENAMPLAVTTGNTIDENFNSIPTTGLTEGLHTLHIRVKGTSNVWSLYKRAYFYIQTPTTSGTPQNIVAAEYFIDADPGVGNGTPDVVTQGMTISETFTIATTSLNDGLHVLHIRVKDADDKWSLYKRAYFYTLSPNSNATATPIIAAEYFFDTDPGVGSATSIGITQGLTIEDDLVIQVPAEMATGDHYLHLRVQDQDGTWSLYKRALINVEPLSVGEFTSESFDIFPNPIKDNIHINFKQFGDYSFSFYDVSGKEIFQQKKLEINNTFDLSKYASGVYILKIKDNENSSFQNIKIVKQ
ncbi:T9SS type A sorting domain-containing protein [Psychroserpens luteus]|uniref:T9SS type A sorting domain-containing protein n=1 Tax=Psychroserpens luteus TaxID=1434066 RepID=A0ABW5ZR93_9FLAO|nr:T9SS type A sorting domain-containing protein [Psychroserpens luteus]